MGSQRMSRYLPGRPGLMLVMGVVVAVVFTVGFVDQALTERAMLAQFAQAQSKVDQLEEQNRLLQQDLDRAQQGQLVPQKAWEYFGKTPKGAGVVIAEPQPVVEPAPPVTVATPISVWRSFWQALKNLLP